MFGSQDFLLHILDQLTLDYSVDDLKSSRIVCDISGSRGYCGRSRVSQSSCQQTRQDCTAISFMLIVRCNVNRSSWLTSLLGPSSLQLYFLAFASLLRCAGRIAFYRGR